MGGLLGHLHPASLKGPVELAGREQRRIADRDDTPDVTCGLSKSTSQEYGPIGIVPVDREPRPEWITDRDRSVVDGDRVGLRDRVNHWRRSRQRARLHPQCHDVFVEQRAEMGATYASFRVVSTPGSRPARPTEHGAVSHDAAFDATDAVVDQLIGQQLEHFGLGRVEAIRQRGVTGSVQDQVALQDAVDNGAGGDHEGEEAILRTEVVKCGGGRDELDVGGGYKRLGWIDGKERVIRIEGDREHAPRGS